MFPQIRSEVAERIARAQDLIRECDRIAKVESDAALPPNVSRTCKGLVFVALYAVYEYAVTTSVQATIRALNAHGLSHAAVGAELLALALHAEFSSARDAGTERLWSRRVGLAVRSRSTDPVSVPEGLFPTDGSHFRLGQLQTIWTIFRVPSAPPVPHPRFGTRIGELVECRNAIAHGRETADQVGSRFTTIDLQQRASDVEALCTHIVGTLESHSAFGASFA